MKSIRPNPRREWMTESNRVIPLSNQVPVYHDSPAVGVCDETVNDILDNIVDCDETVHPKVSVASIDVLKDKIQVRNGRLSRLSFSYSYQNMCQRTSKIDLQ